MEEVVERLGCQAFRLGKAEEGPDYEQQGENGGGEGGFALEVPLGGVEEVGGDDDVEDGEEVVGAAAEGDGGDAEVGCADFGCDCVGDGAYGYAW